MSDEALPESDRADGAPHPRHTSVLFGQDKAEQAFLDAWNTGRLHHAWLITGPPGIGKATLAWRIARFLLDPPEGGLLGAPTTLDTPTDTPLARRVANLSEPRLTLLRRTWNESTKKLRNEITVEEVRKLKSSYTMAAADGGSRVTIVDSIDDMNVNAANAFLKLLEEPPERVTMLLISHSPGRLLPTIRSRCRVLNCSALGANDLRRALDRAGLDAAPDGVTELSGGSVGRAIRLMSQDGGALYTELVGLMSTLPAMNKQSAQRLADSAAGRGAEERYDVLLTLIATLLHRLALTGATGTPPPPAARDEPAMLQRLSPNQAAASRWAELAQAQGARIAHARGVNLDPSSVVLDTLMQMEAIARHCVARSA